jgi:hypothetical protein
MLRLQVPREGLRNGINAFRVFELDLSTDLPFVSSDEDQQADDTDCDRD